MAPVSSLLLRARAPRNDHLILALLISLGLHAGALAIQLHTPRPAVPASRPLEVGLVNAATLLAPLEPQLLAQTDLLAGGDQPEGISTSPLPRTAEALPDEVVLAALRERQQQLEEAQRHLLQRLEARLAIAPPRTAEDFLASDAEPGSDARDQDSLIINARIAALKARIEHYNALPRQRFVGPSTQADAYAHYLESWRTRIEQLGTEHYPVEARGRTYGSLQLTVHIRADGSLMRVEFDRPSEHAVLNMAAQRIVQLAAPFAPLPPAIARETDILAITRTWHFQNQELETRLP